MKKIIYVLIIPFLFANCEKKQLPVKVNITVEKEKINNVLDAWHKSAAEANFDLYFNAMATDAIFIGTDASENWTIPAFKNFSKPYFDKGKAWNFKPIERNVYVNSDGKIAWFDELLDTWMGVCRGSGVLKKNEDTWKIEHYVLSLTIPNGNVEDVIKINKEKDSLFLKKIRK
ncbi:nuclear transport factor 2 family protein [Lutibacter sp.]